MLKSGKDFYQKNDVLGKEKWNFGHFAISWQRAQEIVNLADRQEETFAERSTDISGTISIGAADVKRARVGVLFGFHAVLFLFHR